MTTKIEANKAIKAEQKSFEFCVSLINQMSTLSEVKNFLSERGITSDFLTNKENKQLTCKAELFKYCKLHEFTATNGEKYKAIFTKNEKWGVREAKWSVWRVLGTIDARHKALGEAIKHETSIKEIEVADKGRKAPIADTKPAPTAKSVTAASLKAATKGKATKKVA